MPEPEPLDEDEDEDEVPEEDCPGLRFPVALLANSPKDSMVRDLFAAGLCHRKSQFNIPR